MKDKEIGAISPHKQQNKGNNIQVEKVVRVADDFYQKVITPLYEERWIPRKRKELEKDGQDFKEVLKFFGWTNEPNFLDYKEDIGGWLNLSQPLPYQPRDGDWPTIRKLFEHIFGEQLELGFDYYSLILTKPKQLLPILVLVSEEQGTGKSTLLQFNGFLIGANAVILNVSQYSQQFNGVYAAKLIIGIDETVISEQFIKERLKQDSTATSIQLRKMHSEHQTLPFYGKFILCTNREKDFAKLEKEDMRFWVRKVGKIQQFDADFCTKLKNEVPAFTQFLITRPLSVPSPLSRMWFSPEQLKTGAFEVVVANSISDCAKDIKIWAELHEDEPEFGITETELLKELERKYTLAQVRKALKEELHMENSNKRYNDMFGNPKIGRAYIFNEDMPCGNSSVTSQ
ncbi:MAG: hypothetical protein J6S16_01870 [Bacteroidales bacterium]|nr:hypothetical protein [Bacteroidales bacterium]